MPDETSPSSIPDSSSDFWDRIDLEDFDLEKLDFLENCWIPHLNQFLFRAKDQVDQLKQPHDLT